MYRFKKLLIRVALLALPAVLLLGAASKSELELLMLEHTFCQFCKQFDREVAPDYASSAVGKLAPLRRIDLKDPWPADLVDVKTDRLTPTFILINQGQEAGRLRGYPGPEKFWKLLNMMLSSVGIQ